MLKHGFATYRDVNLLDSSWGIEYIYVLCDAKYIDGIWEDLESVSNSSISTYYI